MQKELLGRQVYQDGVQKEVSSLIQLVTITHFEPFYDLCKIMNIKLDNRYWTKLMDMWNYLAYAIHPNGTTELSNDSNIYNLREILMKKAKKFDRPDWLFIATSGKRGIDPKFYLKSSDSDLKFKKFNFY